MVTKKVQGEPTRHVTGREISEAAQDPRLTPGEEPDLTIIRNNEPVVKPASLTDEEKLFIDSCVADGEFSIPQIADMMGRKYEQVRRQAVGYVRPTREAGGDIKPAAKKHKRYTVAEKRKVKKLYRQGKSYGEIAEIMGRTKIAIQVLTSKEGYAGSVRVIEREPTQLDPVDDPVTQPVADEDNTMLRATPVNETTKTLLSIAVAYRDNMTAAAARAAKFISAAENADDEEIAQMLLGEAIKEPNANN